MLKFLKPNVFFKVKNPEKKDIPELRILSKNNSEQELDNLKTFIADSERENRETIKQLENIVQRLTHENAELKKDLCLLICQDCTKEYFGSTSFISLKQTLCPSCGGNCIPNRIMKIKDLEAKIDELNNFISNIHYPKKSG